MIAIGNMFSASHNMCMKSALVLGLHDLHRREATDRVGNPTTAATCNLDGSCYRC